jgi:hypothetical protein
MRVKATNCDFEFQTAKQNISLHVRSIFEEGELTADATVKDFLTVRPEGERQVQRKPDGFLRFNDRKVLPNAGPVSKKRAEAHARDEYDQFARHRREHKEAIGEKESIKALEEAARQLGGRQNRAKKDA